MMILNIIAFEIQKPNSPGTGHQTNNWIILKIRNFLKEADARYSEIYMVGDLNCTSNIRVQIPPRFTLPIYWTLWLIINWHN